ncbi:MAG TPA: metallophosphoesterase family protein [Saprospiraceae bacterium]|nr:metallophosphoesterase family protein [Saprospiraceae bacterium]
MSQNSQDIGQLQGRVLVFGGVYSNLQALQSMQKVAINLEIPPSNIICTGDITGYCAQPSECLDLIEEWGIHAIRGNVEQNIIDEVDDCGCNFAEGGRCDTFSRQWFPFVKKNMTSSNIQYLEELPNFISFYYANKKFRVVHGSEEHISEFVFKSTPWEIKERNINLSHSDIILAGHAGIPFVDQQDGLSWLNAGVIGMPANDGTTDVWYLLLNDADDDLTYEFHRLQYDFEQANVLMIQNRLPSTYAQTLLNGIWDNCEILPEEEMQNQGKRLVL